MASAEGIESRAHLPGHVDFPRVGFVVTAEDLDQGRLAGSRVAPAGG
jgi:hypothetical protein